MFKSEIRNKFRDRRNVLSPDFRNEASMAIANRLLGLPIWEHLYYHIFLSAVNGREVDTEHVLTILHGKDKNVVVPKVLDSQNLCHYLLLDSTPLKLSRLNIPEPEDGIKVPVSKIDVVFVPLLAFDKQGHRVGYGKGYYDRFLGQCHSKTIKIGLSFFEALDEIADVSVYDIPLNYCISPKKVYQF